MLCYFQFPNNANNETYHSRDPIQDLTGAILCCMEVEGIILCTEKVKNILHSTVKRTGTESGPY